VGEEGGEGEEAAMAAGPVAVYRCNRAACWLSRKQWLSARNDCDKVLRAGRSDTIAIKVYPLFSRPRNTYERTYI
jgi:hypothetical protein